MVMLSSKYWTDWFSGTNSSEGSVFIFSLLFSNSTLLFSLFYLACAASFKRPSSDLICPIGIITLGYPDESPARLERIENEQLVHYERW